MANRSELLRVDTIKHSDGFITVDDVRVAHGLEKRLRPLANQGISLDLLFSPLRLYSANEGELLVVGGKDSSILYRLGILGKHNIMKKDNLDFNRRGGIQLYRISIEAIEDALRAGYFESFQGWQEHVPFVEWPFAAQLLKEIGIEHPPRVRDKVRELIEPFSTVYVDLRDDQNQPLSGPPLEAALGKILNLLSQVDLAELNRLHNAKKNFVYNILT
jgi:hypothetical protein